MRYPQLLKHKKAFIVSMEMLKDRYRKAMAEKRSKEDYERINGHECLLCNPIGILENHSNQSVTGPTEYRHKNKCINLGCPWIVITGETCDHESNIVASEHYTSVYQTKDEEVQQQRIDQLDAWITIYKNN